MNFRVKLPAAAVAAAVATSGLAGYEAGPGPTGPEGCTPHMTISAQEAFTAAGIQDYAMRAGRAILKGCHPNLTEVYNGKTKTPGGNTYLTEYEQAAGPNTPRIDLLVTTSEPAGSPNSWQNVEQVTVEDYDNNTVNYMGGVAREVGDTTWQIYDQDSWPDGSTTGRQGFFGAESAPTVTLLNVGGGKAVASSTTMNAQQFGADVTAWMTAQINGAWGSSIAQ